MPGQPRERKGEEKERERKWKRGAVKLYDMILDRGGKGTKVFFYFFKRAADTFPEFSRRQKGGRREDVGKKSQPSDTSAAVDTILFSSECLVWNGLACQNTKE